MENNINRPADLCFLFSINAPVESVYQAWTQAESLKKFMSPNIDIEAVPGGKFEILFDMNQEEGMRGSEGCRYLALEENKMISFTWNSPPPLKDIRGHHTMVRILLEVKVSTKPQFNLSIWGWGIHQFGWRTTGTFVGLGEALSYRASNPFWKVRKLTSIVLMS